MTRTYYDLTEFVDAAKAQACTVHLHYDQEKPVFSVGNSDIGAREFDTYDEVWVWIEGRAAI